MTLFYLSIAFFLVLAVLNVAIIVSLFKREDISHKQKMYQSTIVFLLPFIGALIIWAFHKGEDIPLSEIKKNGGSSGPDNYTVGGSGID